MENEREDYILCFAYHRNGLTCLFVSEMVACVVLVIDAFYCLL
jgi:hypothetical protein